MQQHDMQNTIDEGQTQIQNFWHLTDDFLILSDDDITIKLKSAHELNMLQKYDAIKPLWNKEFASVPTAVQRDSILVKMQAHFDKAVFDSSIERDKHRTFIWSVLK